MTIRFGFGTTPARFARSPLLTQEGISPPEFIHAFRVVFFSNRCRI